MTEVVKTAVGILTGAALGAFYFAGLWWTLKRLPHARRPATLVLSGYLARLTVCLAGFLLLALAGGFVALIAGLAAFIVMRMVLVGILGPGKNNRLSGEAGVGKAAGGQTGGGA